LEFAVTGILRFISHLELQHYFARRLICAGLPLKFSRGFNPRPRISLPVPRTVGIASLDDRLRAELDEPVDPGPVRDSLQSPGTEAPVISMARVIDGSGLEQARAVEWRIDLAGFDADRVAGRIERILAGPCLMERETKKHHRPFTADVRGFIGELVLENSYARAKVSYGPKGSLRPAELLELLDLPKAECLGRMTRMKTYWE